MLALNPNVILRSEPQYYGTLVAFNYLEAQTTFLDPEEFRILSYLESKQASNEEVANENKISLKKCVKLTKKLKQTGLIVENIKAIRTSQIKRDKINSEFFSKFSVPFLSAPSTVDLFITSKCNLNCVHCFVPVNQRNEMPLEDVAGILDQLEQAGVLEVRINGGEPFSHTYIRKILQILESKRLRKVILTNGTMINDQFAEQLKKAMVTPTVSLDDSDPVIHDQFRGCDGAFKKTLTGLRILRDHGIHFGINCCLHTKNLTKIGELIDLAENSGAVRIAFLDLKACGNSKNNQEWIPNNHEYQTALLMIMMEKLKKRRIDVSIDAFMNCPVLSEMKEEAKKGYVTCEAGRTRLSISSDGSVYPCNTVMGDLRWRMGNLREEKLLDCWFSDKWDFFRGGVKIQDLHKCRECKQQKNCKQIYCRLIPYVETGDPLGTAYSCPK